MNAMREFITTFEKDKTAEKRSSISLVINEMKTDKKEADRMTKEYLNEKLYYFYTTGGPVMDI